jgi:ABC-type nitrate/sulfonate/bicarbonate transport system permease component
VSGLRIVPASALDLLHAYGAPDRTVVAKLQLPYALPSLFASAKIAAPGSIVGATLAEWLATGKGIGSLIDVSAATSQWSTVWTCAVVITMASILIYNLVALVETPLLARYRGPPT